MYLYTIDVDAGMYAYVNIQLYVNIYIYREREREREREGERGREREMCIHSCIHKQYIYTHYKYTCITLWWLVTSHLSILEKCVKNKILVLTEVLGETLRIFSVYCPPTKMYIYIYIYILLVFDFRNIWWVNKWQHGKYSDGVWHWFAPNSDFLRNKRTSRSVSIVFQRLDLAQSGHKIVFTSQSSAQSHFGCSRKSNTLYMSYYVHQCFVPNPTFPAVFRKDGFLSLRLLPKPGC